MKIIGRIFRITYTVAVLAAFAASFPLFSHAWAQDSARDFIREIKLFDTVAHYVRMSYVTEVDATELIHDAIRGMLSGLDEHTAFLEADDFRLLLNDTEGSFGGLGIEISVTPEDDILTVMNVLEGTPAERAGLRARDKIIEIEGESTKGITTRGALLKMRGEPGTDLTIGIARAGFADQLDFTITREIIHIDSVPYHFMASDDVGYVRISNFSRDEERSTSKDAAEALEELREAGMKKFILDLRGNPGGPLDEAVALASLFLKKNALVVYTGGRSERWEERKYYVRDKPEFGKESFVILVDGSSASASEVFTGAIKDHKRAAVLGEKSFGKASGHRPGSQDHHRLLLYARRPAHRRRGHRARRGAGAGGGLVDSGQAVRGGLLPHLRRAVPRRPRRLRAQRVRGRPGGLRRLRRLGRGAGAGFLPGGVRGDAAGRRPPVLPGRYAAGGGATHEDAATGNNPRDGGRRRGVPVLAPARPVDRPGRGGAVVRNARKQKPARGGAGFFVSVTVFIQTTP
jgi:C-terminal peptidase prc